MSPSTIFLLLVLSTITAASTAQEIPETPTVPPKVRATLNARFPGAQIRKLTTEKEHDLVLYDIEFTVEDRRYEADIKEDGSIHNWEREIDPGDLPEPVRTAVKARHPGKNILQAMQITVVSDGQETLEGYELVLETSPKEVEVTVAPDGTILEDSGQSD
jgi:hypothetical protein